MLFRDDLIVDCLTFIRRLKARAIELELQLIDLSRYGRYFVGTVAKIALRRFDPAPGHRGREILSLPGHFVERGFGDVVSTGPCRVSQLQNVLARRPRLFGEIES